jgi:ribosomal protein S14
MDDWMLLTKEIEDMMQRCEYCGRIHGVAFDIREGRRWFRRVPELHVPGCAERGTPADAGSDDERMRI